MLKTPDFTLFVRKIGIFAKALLWIIFFSNQFLRKNIYFLSRIAMSSYRGEFTRSISLVVSLTDRIDSKFIIYFVVLHISWTEPVFVTLWDGTVLEWPPTYSTHSVIFVLRKSLIVFCTVFSLSHLAILAQNSSCDAILSWVCGNGECIGINERCNGKVDCSDGSDETVLECISFQCREDKFRCSYGACVEHSAECNGEKVISKSISAWNFSHEIDFNSIGMRR